MSTRTIDSYLYRAGLMDDLKRNNVAVAIEKSYNQKHRMFHYVTHVYEILTRIDTNTGCAFDEDSGVYTNSYKSLILAALFHDVVYDPTRPDNEEKSVEFMLSKLNGHIDETVLQTASNLIQATSEIDTQDPLAKEFNSYDRAILGSHDFAELVNYGDDIRREYIMYDYQDFALKHVEVISKMHACGNFTNKAVFDAYCSYVLGRKIKLGIYAGSFNPLHIGHVDILRKATSIFDQVILAECVNPNKPAREHDDSAHVFIGDLGYFKRVVFPGMLAELYDHYYGMPNYEVTLIKGIRNADDLQSENTQLAYTSEYARHNVSVVYIPAEPELRHVSSSAIRSLQSLGQDVSRYLA